MKVHRNNIGFLRLLLASGVIISHSPEMIDGDNSREPLSLVFHTVSLGGVCLAGFFILSGWLITSSMMKTDALTPYLARRTLRIVPAYLVAYLISVFVLGPIVLANLHGQTLHILVNMLFLHMPPTIPRPGGQNLNGALWTIAFEFRCYLIVALLWLVGALRRRWIIAALALLTLVAMVVANLPAVAANLDRINGQRFFDLIVGQPSAGLLFLAMFLAGSTAFLYREELMPKLSGAVAALATLVMAAGLFIPQLAYVALIIAGGSVLLWLAFKADLGPLQKINESWDISYGTYLYGFPIASTLLFLYPGISPMGLTAVTLPLALLAGAASWWGLEKWVKDLGRRRMPKKSATTPQMVSA